MKTSIQPVTAARMNTLPEPESHNPKQSNDPSLAHWDQPGRLWIDLVLAADNSTFLRSVATINHVLKNSGVLSTVNAV